MNLETLAMDVIRPALQQANLAWHGWHAFRRGLATNLHRLGVSDKVIQQILRHANVSTTMNIYVKTVSADAALNFRTPKQYTRLRLLRIACLSFIEMLSTVSTYDRYEREQLRSYRTHSPQALYLFYW